MKKNKLKKSKPKKQKLAKKKNLQTRGELYVIITEPKAFRSLSPADQKKGNQLNRVIQGKVKKVNRLEKKGKSSVATEKNVDRLCTRLQKHLDESFKRLAETQKEAKKNKPAKAKKAAKKKAVKKTVKKTKKSAPKVKKAKPIRKGKPVFSNALSNVLSKMKKGSKKGSKNEKSKA